MKNKVLVPRKKDLHINNKVGTCKVKLDEGSAYLVTQLHNRIIFGLGLLGPVLYFFKL